MDVLLTGDEAMLRNIARAFLEAECPPALARKMESDPKGYPEVLWRKTAELGWQGMALPEKYGGLDLHLWFRRVSAWTMRLGTTYEHRARIARALLDHPGRVVVGQPVPVVADA